MCFQLAAKGKLSPLLVLLEKDGTRATAVDQRSWTCMHHAAKHGHVQVVDILLQHGAGE